MLVVLLLLLELEEALDGGEALPVTNHHPLWVKCLTLERAPGFTLTSTRPSSSTNELTALPYLTGQLREVLKMVPLLYIEPSRAPPLLVRVEIPIPKRDES